MTEGWISRGWGRKMFFHHCDAANNCIAGPCCCLTARRLWVCVPTHFNVEFACFLYVCILPQSRNIKTDWNFGVCGLWWTTHPMFTLLHQWVWSRWDNGYFLQVLYITGQLGCTQQQKNGNELRVRMSGCCNWINPACLLSPNHCRNNCCWWPNYCSCSQATEDIYSTIVLVGSLRSALHPSIISPDLYPLVLDCTWR